MCIYESAFLASDLTSKRTLKFIVHAHTLIYIHSTYGIYVTDVFCNFEKDGEFFCFAGQSNQAVTGLYNLNRASQIAFPGEEILRRAKSYSYKFLREKQHCGQLLDKWIITKDLPGEVPLLFTSKKETTRARKSW